MELPAPIQDYFAANARLDADGMAAPFAPDAVVRDERRTHSGIDEIRAWIEQASIGNRAIASPQTIRSEGGRHLVTAHVSGPFPGSPITLAFRFRLVDGQIAELEIG